MPTYEYACEACGHEFEEFQSMTAKPIKKCPDCGKLKVKRLISGGGGILFKGTGFYQTDYRSSGYNEAAKKDKPAPPSSDKKSSSKKPSSKSKPKSKGS